MINLLLIEDDLYIQEALSAYLLRQPEFQRMDVFSSSEEFEQQLPSTKPDVVILDINLPQKSGIELIPTLLQHFPETSILMLSVNIDTESVFRSLQAGASGYLKKETPFERIKEAIIDLFNGGSPITPAIARKVVDFFNTRKHVTENLNEREKQVVDGIVKGLSYKLIADSLNISIDTVRKYVKSTYKKLQINSKGELLARYIGDNR